jgi:hypothetical protein
MEPGGVPAFRVVYPGRPMVSVSHQIRSRSKSLALAGLATVLAFG